MSGPDYDSEIPWIKWSAYTSRDKNNPDKLQIKVVSTEPFETNYGTSVGLLLLFDGQYKPRNMTIKSDSSNNIKLQKLWDTNVKRDRIREGVSFSLMTYKRKSTKSDYEVRDFWMQFS